MVETVEISSLDLRYESHRMRNTGQERKLLAAIVARGIEDPLEGVDTHAGRILLNGFKRYRCAKRLGQEMVPYVSLGNDEAMGIVALLQVSKESRMGILEEASFIADLKDVHGMSRAEIAQTLSRSSGWVSMRLQLLGELSAKVRKKIFSGAFPVYSYMYTLRPFMRMKEGASTQEIEKFVGMVSGKKLSVREIEQLANGYFRGPEQLRKEIGSGNVAFVLDWMREVPANPDGCSEFERVLLKDLQQLQKYMQRVMGKAQDPRLESRAFYAQAHLLLMRILGASGTFLEVIGEFRDRCSKA